MTRVRFSCILFFLLTCAFPGWSEMRECSSLSELLPYANYHTLIVCDLDNTILRSSTQMGSAEWRTHIRQKLANLHIPEERAADLLEHIWRFVQPLIKVEYVEASTPDTLQLLKTSTIVMGLTGREPLEAPYTMKQLESLQVDLSENLLSGCLLDNLNFPALYLKGVAFCGDNPKGEVLQAILSQINWHPKQIVFIDDKWEEVKDLEKYVHDCDYVGLRYGGADMKVLSFNPQVADIEWNYLPKVLTDAEAIRILRHNRTK